MTDKKETTKVNKKAPGLATQRYLQMAEVHDDTLVLKSGGIRAVLEVSSVNFNLKSEAEQESIIISYQRYLNALNFPTQILIKSQKLNIDQYVADLEAQKKKLTNKLLQKQMEEYIDYVSKLVEYAEIMDKKFYVVIPVDPPRAKKKGVLGQFWDYIRPDDKVLNVIKRKQEFSRLRRELDTRVNVVTTGLSNCGLSLRNLNTEEIIHLLYESYNPDLSQNQKVTQTEQIAVENES